MNLCKKNVRNNQRIMHLEEVVILYDVCEWKVEWYKKFLSFLEKDQQPFQ